MQRSLVAPGAPSPFWAALPPTWPDLDAALEWCREQAAELPLRTLAPLTLVWKLAGHVQFLATGHASSHSIVTSELPGIFEQLVCRTQPDPEPLPRYRPQNDEPQMGFADGNVRLLLASGGFGKTAWAAEALLHCAVRTAYYDVATTASESLASSVFLEVCSRLYDSVGAVPAGVVLPGRSPISSLKALDVALRQGGARLAIIVDDIQRADPETVAELVRSTTYIHWILLGQPSPGVTTLRALLGLDAEAFQGWSEETVALVCGEAGCRFSPGDILELRSLTGGAPLYVLNLAALAGSAYGGSISDLCRAVRAGTHAQRTWQEAALGLISGRLSAGARTIACVSAVSGVPISAEEIARLGSACLLVDAQEVGGALRELTDWRVLQGTADGRLRLQDEFGLVFATDARLGREQRTALERELKELLLASIRAGTKETARLFRFLELLGSLEEWEELIDVVTGISEWLRELGFDAHIYSILEHGAAATADAPAQRFWFNDTLAFLDISEGRVAPAELRVAEMKAALAALDLGHRAHGTLILKEMMLAGLRGDFELARQLFESRPTDLQDPVVERVFRYNYACLAWKSERWAEAQAVLVDLLKELLGMLGLSLEDVVLRKEALIWKSIGGGKEPPLRSDALKHTADAFDLLSHVERQLGDGRWAAQLSIQAFKFYNMSGAISSLVRVGEDVAEDLLIVLDDPWEARRFLEQALLPAIRDHRLVGHALSVRCQYAFVLARCGEPGPAAELLRSLEPYLPDAGEKAQRKVAELRSFIGVVEEQMRLLPSACAPRNADGTRRPRHLRPGRNDRCPCGSGRKQKRCCASG